MDREPAAGGGAARRSGTVLALAAAVFVMAGAWPAHATPPTVASIERYCVPGPCPTNTNALIWVVSFSEKVKQVDQSDFALGFSPAILDPQPTLSVVAADTRHRRDGVGESLRWELTLSGESLKGYEGTVTLSFVSSPTIQDVAGNRLANTMVTGTNENTYVLGSVTSITRTPAYGNERTTLDTLKWRVTFNEDVQNVSTNGSDFTVTGTTATLAVAADGSSKKVYDVTASGGDLANLDATVTLGFASGQDIENAPAGVALTDTTPTGANDNTYQLDNIAPSLVSITRQRPGVDTTDADTLTWRLTFSEPVFGVWADVDDVYRPDDFNDFNVTIDPAPTNAPTLKTTRVGGYDAQGGNPFYPVSNVFDLTLYGGDLATLDGTVTLTTSNDCSFWDQADIWALGLVPGFGNELACSGSAPLTPTSANDNIFVVDNSSPTVAITGVPARANGAFTATFTFSHAVTGFEVGDITLTGATASNFTNTVPGTVWTALITPTANYSVSVAANAATDAANRGNTASATKTGTYDTTVPGITITGVPARANGAFTATFTFSRAVTGFVAGDITLTGATASSFTETVTGTTWTALITPTADYSVSVVAGVATDAADNTKSNTASATTHSGAYDTTAPTVEIIGVQHIPDTSFTVTFTFSEAMRDFVVGDITLVNAKASAFTNTVAGTAWTALITPTLDGLFYVSVEADAATDLAGNGNKGSTIHSGTFSSLHPRVESIKRHNPSTSPTGADALTWRVTFDEDVTNVYASVFRLSGTTATLSVAAVVADGVTSKTVYDVTASGGDLANYNGTVTLSFAANSPIVNEKDYTLVDPTPIGANEASYVVDNAGTPPPPVTDLVPTLSGAIADQELTQGAAYTSAAAFPAATGGDGTISYSVDGLPAGVTLNNDRKLTGTATAPLARTALTYTATDSDATDPDSATLTFNLSVAPKKPADFTATVGDTKVTLSWTAIAGVTGWEVRQDSGSWTPIADSSAATNSHTVTGLTNGASYTFQVRAYVGDSGVSPSTRVDGVESDAESATPAADLVPALTGAIADQELTQGAAYTSAVAFPAATGGNVPITYSVDGLPGGVTLNSNRKLTGTATAPLARTELIYTATDSDATDPDSATLTFNISVRPKAVTLSGSAGDGAVHLTWTAIAGVITWQIEQDGGAWTDIPGSGAATNSHTVTGLTDRTEYTFRVRAVVGSGDRAVDGVASNQVSVTPDGTAPTVTSIARQDPSGSPTNADRLTWRVTFSEGVTGVDAADFSVTGTTATVTAMAASETAANETSSTAWDVTVSGGDLAEMNGTVTLGFASGQNIVDRAGNALIDTTPMTGTNENTYVLDNAAPTVAISGVPTEADGPFTATFTFSEPVTGFEVGDITVTGGTASDFSGSGKTYTASITPTADYRVAVAANVAMDAAGNGNAASDVKTGTFRMPDTAERRALKGTLAGFARATLRGATATLNRRFESAPGAAALTLAGVPVAANGARASGEAAGSVSAGDPWTQPYGSRSVDSDRLLGQSAFALPLGDVGDVGAAGDGEGSAGFGWTIWGGGDLQQFEGTSSTSRHDGSLRSGWLGVDARMAADRFLGIAVSRSHGEADYRFEANAGGGALDVSLTALWAYLQLGTQDGPRVRVLGGIGVGGEAEHRPDKADRATERARLSMGLASASGQWPVARTGAVALSLTGDAGVVNMATAGSGTATAGLAVSALQVRGGVEARHDGITLGGDGGDGWLRLAPFGSLLLRHDGGDGITGTGVEIEGGFTLGAPGSRFSVDARGRWLALHSASGARDWGLGLNARLAPDATGRGLSFAVGPRWGTPEGGALQGEGVFADDAGGTPGTAMLSMGAGYGFGAGPGVLTPFAETDLGGGNRRYTAGLGYRAPGGLDARFTGEHRAPETGKADLRIGFGLRLAF